MPPETTSAHELTALLEAFMNQTHQLKLAQYQDLVEGRQQRALDMKQHALLLKLDQSTVSFFSSSRHLVRAVILGPQIFEIQKYPRD